MRIPGGISLIYVLYMAVILPMAAIRSKRRFESANSAGAFPKQGLTRTTIYLSTLVSLTLLFFLSWAVGQTFQYGLFPIERIGVPEIGIELSALAFQFVMMLVARAVRSPEERRTMAVYKIVPRTATEWALFVPVCVAAG